MNLDLADARAKAEFESRKAALAPHVEEVKGGWRCRYCRAVYRGLGGPSWAEAHASVCPERAAVEHVRRNL